MLFKIKKECIKNISFIMNKGAKIDFMEDYDNNTVFLKVSDKLRSYQMETYINVLYKNNIGWVNQKYIEQL